MGNQHIYELAKSIKENVGRVIVGKEEIVDLLLVGLISSGHVLMEDVPGMGKTLLAKALSKSLACQFSRIQFTPDLLPSDLTGVHFYNQKNSEFEFRAGPLFTNILLADEINRATPRTQSSLLECMEERQITIEGESHRLERPFMVIATQNPIESQGTFPLPEAQLDRFLLKISMGYPTVEQEKEILLRFKETQPLETLNPVASVEAIVTAQNEYTKTKVTDAVLDYIVNLAKASREHKDLSLGISPRGTQAILRAVQIYAILQGRDYVLPDDVKKMAEHVWCHRFVLKGGSRLKEGATKKIMDELLDQIPVPAETDLMS